jgi:hypothetical protein
MKPDNRLSQPQAKDSTPRAAATTPASDIEAQLAALKAQEQENQRRQAELRQSLWDAAITDITARISQLAAYDFDRAAIAKALGFAARPGKVSSSRVGTGPTTQDGWYSFFRKAGVRTYLKSHPELVSSLKSRGVAAAEMDAHLPSDATRSIEESARKRAAVKCPAKTATEVPAA